MKIVDIKVETQYLEDQMPNEDKFAFAYKITVHNLSQHVVQLISRYWLITDGNGKKTEVEGPGVIGQQPHIKPGESFQYTSGAILDTPVGTMQGYYQMQQAEGQQFQAPIQVFTLAVPNAVN